MFDEETQFPKSFIFAFFSAPQCTKQSIFARAPFTRGIFHFLPSFEMLIVEDLFVHAGNHRNDRYELQSFLSYKFSVERERKSRKIVRYFSPFFLAASLRDNGPKGSPENKKTMLSKTTAASESSNDQTNRFSTSKRTTSQSL